MQKVFISPPMSEWGRVHPPTLADVADDDTLNAVFDALANDTRRGNLAMLHDFGGYMTSQEIMQRFDSTWQTVSRHLKVLTDAGLISCDVRGRGRAYTLERARLQSVAGRWISRVATQGERSANGILTFHFDD
jgi:DNA-binding transcriptional ArsR family regulator